MKKVVLALCGLISIPILFLVYYVYLCDNEVLNKYYLTGVNFEIEHFEFVDSLHRCVEIEVNSSEKRCILIEFEPEFIAESSRNNYIGYVKKGNDGPIDSLVSIELYADDTLISESLEKIKTYCIGNRGSTRMLNRTSFDDIINIYNSSKLFWGEDDIKMPIGFKLMDSLSEFKDYKLVIETSMGTFTKKVSIP